MVGWGVEAGAGKRGSLAFAVAALSCAATSTAFVSPTRGGATDNGGTGTDTGAAAAVVLASGAFTSSSSPLRTWSVVECEENAEATYYRSANKSSSSSWPDIVLVSCDTKADGMVKGVEGRPLEVSCVALGEDVCSGRHGICPLVASDPACDTWCICDLPLDLLLES